MSGCLILINPLDPATGGRIPVNVGYSLNSRVLKADGIPWHPAVSRAPRISMDFLDDALKGQLQTGKAGFVINIDRWPDYTEDYRRSLVWVGAPVTIYSGSEVATANMFVEFVGQVVSGSIDASSGMLALQCEVDRKLLDVPLLNLEYGGGGGADGDVETRGQLKPASFGKPVNVPVFFFDQVNSVGQVDAYGNCTAIDTLYEDAASFGTKQGNYASYAALVAATIPEGSWATCVAEGMIRLGAEPRGVITCDPICGAGTPGTMALRWLQTHAGITAGRIDSGSFTVLDATLTTLLGHAPAVSYYTQSQVQVLDRLQALMASCNAVPLIGPNGKIMVTRAISASPAALTLNRKGGTPRVTDWRALDGPEPWWRIKMEAAKTWRVHQLSEIDYEDDIVDLGDYVPFTQYRQGNVVRLPSDGNRYIYINATPSATAPPTATHWDLYEEAPDAAILKYVDGTPIENLKPAQIGADVTATHTAAAITGQGALATVSTITTQIEAGRTNDNVVPNANLVDGSSKWTLGGGMTIISAAAHGAMPAYNALQIPNGVANAVAYANSATQIPYGHTRAYVSASVFTSGSNPMGTIYIACYDYLGAYITDVVVPALSANGPFAWHTAIGGWVTLPANTRAILPYWFGGAAVAYTRTLTNLRVAPTALLATVGGTLGTDIYSSTGVVQTDSTLITSMGTAASITGQAPTATSSDYAVITGDTRPSPYAGTSLVPPTKVGETAKFSFVGNRMQLLTALTAGWRAIGYNWQTFPNGFAISARTLTTAGQQIFGFALATHINNADTAPYYQMLAHGWYLNGIDAYSMAGGSYTLRATNVSTTDNLAMAYNGITVFYLINGTVFHSVNVGRGVVYFPKFLVENNSGSPSNSGWQDIQVSPFAEAADMGSNIYDLSSGNYQVVPRGEIRTPLGTAAAIASQGWFATANALDLEDTTRLTNRTRISRLAAATGRIIDARGLESNRSYGLRSLFDSPAFTDTWVGANNVTINIPASTLYTDFGTTLSLPSGSVTNCSAGTLYYLYRNMADPADATGTYAASTSLATALGTGKVYLGAFTTRATSGGSGSGGGYGGIDCVDLDACVLTDKGAKRARDIVQGDTLVVLDELTMNGVEHRPVDCNFPGSNDCVTIITQTGITLTLAVNTPITLRDGGMTIAANCAGCQVPVLDKGEFRWELVERVEYAGFRPVAHIVVGGKTYAAGRDDDRFILTHNPIYKQ